MSSTETKAPFSLPALPWDEGALAPVISAETIGFHYGKHHQAYVNKLNELVAGTDLAEHSLEAIIKRTVGDSSKKGVFNNAAQVWNHTFYWHSLAPAATSPSSALASRIDEDFGGMEQFAEKFAAAGVGQFGSGWAWLVASQGKLSIETSGNAETPMAHGHACLLTLDVWEHAYYLDYQNRRPDYLKAAISKLNWKRASELFEQAG